MCRFLALLLLCTYSIIGHAQSADSLAHHLSHLLSLSTLIGTDAANTTGTSFYNEATSEAHGQTLPAVCTPHAQTLYTPQTRRTEQKCIAPYYYADSLFHGIRASHWIVGGCTQDYGSFTLTLGKDIPLDHTQEEAHPHYYRLTADSITLELTAYNHSAIIRLSQDIPIHLEINSDEQQGHTFTDSLRQVIFAENPVHRIYQGWGEPAGFSGYIAIYYGKAPTYYLATSFTSCEAALSNLLVETDSLKVSFSQMQQRCAHAWMQRMHTLCVEDADTERVSQFYSALYRASLLPREISDCDGTYPRFSSYYKTASAEHPIYGDFSMWDIYRAQLPLLNLIDPIRSGHMMQSLVNMYEQGGWLPIFPCWNSYTAAMIGDHAAVALADAYVKGVRNFDAATAYKAMRRNAFHLPRSKQDYRDGKGRRALRSYLRYGYIPLEDSVPDAFHTQEQTSRTLEYAFDDFAVAQMAKALGHNRDYKRLMERADNWRNVFNPQTLYADGRHADGTFLNHSRQELRTDFLTEGAPLHYSLYVPHNPTALAQLLGGAQQLEQRLDSLFANNYYWHGNEPCHHIPFLYNFCGRPDKTSATVRHILDTEYNATPGGLSGNDDAGQLSAWYVFAAMGLYPLCPATTTYQLCQPLFRKVTIHQSNGHDFVIRRWEHPQTDKSTQIDHADILRGIKN